MSLAIGGIQIKWFARPSESLATSVTLTLQPIPPFRLDYTVWALRRRERNLIDRWDGATYRRVVVVEGCATELAIRQSDSKRDSKVLVVATPPPRTAAQRRQLRAIVDRLLGLQIDLTDWYRIAEADDRLGDLARRFQGMKPPRFATVFEAVVNGFACQQLSLEVGLELLNRLARISGARFDEGSGPSYAFPTAADLLRLPVGAYRAIGYSGQKTKAIRQLAVAAVGGLALDSLVDLEDAAVRERLLNLHGVGRWTAEYVLLRGLGRLDTFPGDDVGARKRLAKWLGRSVQLDYAAVAKAVERWQPYAGLVYFHLLLHGLSETGIFEQTSEMPLEG